MEKEGQDNQEISERSGSVNPFLPLREVVYAPLDALAASNAQLGRTVIDEIRSMGKTELRNNEEVLYLDKLNLAYRRMRSGDNSDYTEDIQVEVPLLSLAPVPNLKIRNAEVDFSVELMEQGKGEKEEIMARICAGTERETSEEPRIDYKIKLGAVEETEGYLRILDILNVSSVAKILDQEPLPADGGLREGEKEAFLKGQALKRQEAALHRLYREITEFMEDRKKFPDEVVAAGRDPKEDEARYERIKKNIMAEMLQIRESILEGKVRALLERRY